MSFEICRLIGFEALGGNRAGQYSIRINDQWRLCFKWAVTDDMEGIDELLMPGEPYGCRDYGLSLTGIIERSSMAYTAQDNLPPVHPGEILREELDALGMSARKFASHIGVPANAITAILNGKRGISAAMALRLGKAFDTGERYWINLQSYYETR